MKKLLCFLCVFYASFSFSQQWMLPGSLVDQYLLDKSVNKDIILETKLDKDDFYETKLTYKGKSTSFKLKPLTYPNFEAKLKQAISDIIKEVDTVNLKFPESDSKSLQNDITSLFTQIITYHNTEEERPQVATIFLKENIPVYYNTDDESDEEDKVLAKQLSDVQVEISFFGGFIEKMQVNGKVDDIPVSFNNKYSIGISSTKNIKQLNTYKLFTNEQFAKSYFKDIANDMTNKLIKLKEIEVLEKTLKTAIYKANKETKALEDARIRVTALEKKIAVVEQWKKDRKSPNIPVYQYIALGDSVNQAGKLDEKLNEVKAEVESLKDSREKAEIIVIDLKTSLNKANEETKELKIAKLKVIEEISNLEKIEVEIEGKTKDLKNAISIPKSLKEIRALEDEIDNSKEKKKENTRTLDVAMEKVRALEEFKASQEIIARASRDSLAKADEEDEIIREAKVLMETDEDIKFEEAIKKIKDQREKEAKTKAKTKNSLKIHVGDVIRYVKNVDINANDISPVPQLVILDKNQKETKLYREESSKLFEAVVYTDFLGVFDEENPNGIIQTEVNKRFNISTRRFDGFDKFIEGWGGLQYFNAHFQFSKIEKNNKFLLPAIYTGVDENGLSFSENYYTPLSLYQYRNFSIGGNMNILFLENQNAKMNVTVDAGFLFGRSGIKETEEQVDGEFLNNLELPVEVKFLILPEKRVSFAVSDRLSWFESFDSEVNLRSVEKDILVSKNRWLNTFNVGINVDVSTSGKLFLRYKLVHEWDNINNNFSQLQFGYSFYLLQKNGVRKKE